MMSADASKKDKDQDQKDKEPVDKPEQQKVPPRGRTFGGRGVEKRG